MRNVFLLALVAGSTFAQQQPVPIKFSSTAVTNLAISSLSNDGTILIVDGVSSAQFLYTKMMTPADPSPGLSTVYLMNDELGGRVLQMQLGFDVISQTCSCYWIDATEIDKQVVGGVKTSGKYYLQIIGPAFTVDSGLIGIQRPGEKIGTTKSSGPVDLPTGPVIKPSISAGEMVAPVFYYAVIAFISLVPIALFL